MFKQRTESLFKSLPVVAFLIMSLCLTHGSPACGQEPVYQNGEETVYQPKMDTLFIGDEIPINLTPNYSHVFYGNDSIKEAADIVGLYGFIDTKYELFEFGWDMFDLQYKDQSHLTQNDFTLAYTNYFVENWKLRTGTHYIDSTSELSDGAYIFFGGAHYYETDVFDVGSDITYSRYRDNLPSVNILQFTPHLGWYISKTDNWFIRADLTGYGIFLNTDVGLDKQEFYSGEARVSAGSGSLNYSLFGWVGQQTFAVRNNGFVVFNLSELHRHGFGGDVTYKFSENTNLKGFISNEKFKDFVNDLDSYQLV